MALRAGAAAGEPHDADVGRWLITVRGLVQGVGFRPFVYAVATSMRLAGTVVNDSDGVLIEVEGEPVVLHAFLQRLTTDAPPLAIIEQVGVQHLPPDGRTGFAIGDTARSGTGRTLASPDVATCVDCLADLTDPGNRRHRHPFVSCTNCGPRFTIITALPYDRIATTMAGFAMCRACAAEYGNPADRRFHAQPIACRDCGPRLEFSDHNGRTVHGDDAAMAAARGRLAAGDILAVKGLGGYHLVCDARNETAVGGLRSRKRRGDKPFAVMVADLDAARRCAEVTGAEADLLCDPARPIVLLRRRGDANLAPAVAPGNPDLGLLLPYTPLHALLFGLPGDEAGPDVLVMTSGNLSGEPIVTDNAAALEQLSPLVDGWLRHDRDIQVPCDDSVCRVVDGEVLPIRRSRGYAPLPIPLTVSVTPALAVGADLKNTCCVADGRYAWMSQHIGDMDDLRSVDTLGRSVFQLESLTGVEPGLLIADRHPGYRSVRWAREHRAGRSLRTVQHHHAHICSVMAENGLDGTAPVIGLAFDGTGYGTDGAVWGGEVLLADYAGFRRYGHLTYVPLPGGDATVERPYRMALAHLWAAGLRWDDDLPPVAAAQAAERSVLDRQLATGFGCVQTSSMGRLFDAVSALAGVRQVADYEAQAAIELEGLSRPVGAEWRDVTPYRFALRASGNPPDPSVLADPGPVIRAVVDDWRAGAGAPTIGARFHAAVVDLGVVWARAAREAFGVNTVALSGGVFQNALLLGDLCVALRRAEFGVLRHRRVPPNDGGLALGQLLAGTSAHYGDFSESIFQR